MSETPTTDQAQELEQLRSRVALLDLDNQGHAEYLGELHAELPEGRARELLGRLLERWGREPGESVYVPRSEAERLHAALTQAEHELSFRRAPVAALLLIREALAGGEPDPVAARQAASRWLGAEQPPAAPRLADLTPEQVNRSVARQVASSQRLAGEDTTPEEVEAILSQAAASPCAACQRPIDDPQTCEDCGKMLCTSCAAYSEDAEQAWCGPCAQAQVQALAAEALTLLATFVDAAKRLDEAEAAVRSDPARLDTLRSAIADRHLAAEALEALDSAALRALAEILTAEVEGHAP